MTKFKLKIKNLKLKIFAKQAGFTVLESIVAIAVLSLSIAGSFMAVQKSLSQSSGAKDEVKAFYLAQEAIEIIKNKRDTNQLAKINSPQTSTTWLSGITNASNCPFNGICVADATTYPPSLISCGTTSWGGCPSQYKYLTQDTNRGSSSTYIFGYNSSYPATSFQREIKIEQVSLVPDAVSITVKITWTVKGVSKSFLVKTIMFNWV